MNTMKPGIEKELNLLICEFLAAMRDSRSDPKEQERVFGHYLALIMGQDFTLEQVLIELMSVALPCTCGKCSTLAHTIFAQFEKIPVEGREFAMEKAIALFGAEQIQVITPSSAGEQIH